MDTVDSRETMISYSEICESSLEPNEPEFLRLTRLRRSGRLQLKDRVQYEESPGPTLPPTQQSHDGGANADNTVSKAPAGVYAMVVVEISALADKRHSLKGASLRVVLAITWSVWEPCSQSFGNVEWKTVNHS